MNDLPEPIAKMLAAQLAERRNALRAGHRHVGWKVAGSMPGVDEYLGRDGTVFGYLTSATLLPPAGVYVTRDAGELRAETETAVRLGADIDPGGDPPSVKAAISALGVAIEIVDTARPHGGTKQIVTDNVFHRAVAFGEDHEVSALGGSRSAYLTVNGKRRAEVDADIDPAAVLLVLARQLAALGERLSAGDRVITGSLTHVPVARGDTVTMGITGLGDIGLMIR